MSVRPPCPGIGATQHRPFDSTNSGDGFVYVSNNTNFTYPVCQNTRGTMPPIIPHPWPSNCIHKVDFVNFQSVAGNNYDQIVYIHPNDFDGVSGFHYITRDSGFTLIDPCVPPLVFCRCCIVYVCIVFLA